MIKGDLDSYIANFAHLAIHAGYDKNHSATVDIFKRGLNRKLALACVRRDNPPTTINEWIDAARKEQKKYAEEVNFMEQVGEWTLPTGWNTKPPKVHQTRRHPNDEVVPMDVDDMGAYKATTSEEKKVHREQGRCYN